MNQSSALTQSLAESQERHAHTTVVTYTVYTESKPNLSRLIARYFPGATIHYGLGLWQEQTEPSATISIVGTFADLQRIADLAGDIRVVNEQSTVLVTWQRCSRLDV